MLGASAPLHYLLLITAHPIIPEKDKNKMVFTQALRCNPANLTFLGHKKSP